MYLFIFQIYNNKKFRYMLGPNGLKYFEPGSDKA